MKKLVLFLSCVVLAAETEAQNPGVKKIIAGDIPFGVYNFWDFTYSGNRGSDVKNNIINYDSSYLFYYSNYPKRHLVLGGTLTKKYDTSNREIYYQSRMQSTVDSTEYSVYEKWHNYDTVGRVVKIKIKDHDYSYDQEYTYNYNSNGLLKEVFDTVYGTFVYVSNAIGLYYTYDTAGRLTSVLKVRYSIDPPGTYNKYERTNYYYNANNAVESLEYQVSQYIDSLRSNSMTTYTYDNLNRLTEINYYGGVGPNRKLYTKQINFYSTGPKAVKVEHYQLDITTSIVALTAVKDYTYNIDNDTISVLEKQWNKYDQRFFYFQKGEYSYNKYKQPETYRHFKYSVGDPPADSTIVTYTYIYEDWPLNLATASSDNILLVTYPNPTSEVLTIRADIAAGKDFYVVLYNMEGRIIKQWLENNASANYIKSIQVSELPPGNYIIKLSGQGIQGSARFSIVK